MPTCKFCSSKELVKAGIHYAGGRKQRWLCKNCGRIFISPFPKKPDLKRLAQALRGHGVKKAVLFGSYARGEAQPGSDIDILVEFSKPVGLKLFRIQRELSEMFGVKVEVGTELSPHVMENVKQEAKVIVGE